MVAALVSGYIMQVFISNYFLYLVQALVFSLFCYYKRNCQNIVTLLSILFIILILPRINVLLSYVSIG